MSSPRRGLTFFLLGSVMLFLFSAAFTVGFSVGVFHGQKKPAIDNFLSDGDIATLDTELFWEVWSEVRHTYIQQPVEDRMLFYGAVAGVADAVDDPYTVYLSPDETKEFNEILSGEFEGIGAEIGLKDGQIVVIAPLAGTPAETAGLEPNDAIVKIDGKETTGMSIDEAIALIRGSKGTTVTLTIYRAGDVDFREIPITRETIVLESAAYEVFERDGKRFGVLSLYHVPEGSSAAITEITQKILLDMPNGLIFDLRNNPGGLLDEAIAISSLFIEDGTIVQEQASDGTLTAYPALGSASLATTPKMIVLVNKGTASAAEIIAGALQDHGRARIIGEQTFGKGSVQDFRSFDDGSSLKITVAYWLTPNGRVIDERGIAPDGEVELKLQDVEAGIDTQLEAAIDELLK